MAFLSSLIGQDLYEVEKALVDLSDFDQHINHVSRVERKTRGDKRKRGMSGLFEHRCGKICMKPKFLRKKFTVRFCANSFLEVFKT